MKNLYETTTESKPREYDSAPETHEHIKRVGELLMEVIGNLGRRKHVHDCTKLVEPEKSGFDRMTPKLKHSTYGSEEYKGFLKELQEILAHHYACNDHHPEHYGDGVRGMNLLALLEMLCDWKAAGERHKDGSMAKSLAHNRKRFNISDELFTMLVATCIELTWVSAEEMVTHGLTD